MSLLKILPNAVDSSQDYTFGSVSASTITANGIQLSAPASIANVWVSDSSYNVLDDTAANTTGGYIVVRGSNFQSGSMIIVGTNNATSTTVVNSSIIRAQVPAAASGTYPVYLVAPDGSTSIKVNGLTHSSFPAWGTAATLANTSNNMAFSVSLSANSDSSITYSNTTVLPTGTTLLSNGYFYGTVTVGSSTTYSFGVKATDAENQDATRSFILNVNIEPTLFMGGSAGVPAGTTITDTSHVDTNRTGNKAFDNSLDEITDCWHSNSNPPGATATLSISFTSQRRIDQYRMFLRFGSDWKPNAWTLQGSNDGSSWTTVDTRSSQSSNIPSVTNRVVSDQLSAGNYASYTVATPGSYQYYNFVFTGISNYVVIGEILLYSL